MSGRGLFLEHGSFARQGLGLVVFAVAASMASAGAGEVPEALAGGPLLAAEECGRCHGGQFRRWSSSSHATHEVQCYECHGRFHSGTMQGCRRCHQAVHSKRFAHWPEVSRFEDDSGTDFLCIVCHEPHVSSLTSALRDGCYPCHGNAVHAGLSDLVHRGVAGAISPIHMDQYARESTGIAPWMASLSAPRATAVRGGLLLAAYALCFVVLLPFGYFGVAVVNALRRRGGRSGGPAGGEA